MDRLDDEHDEYDEYDTYENEWVSNHYSSGEYVPEAL